VATALFLMAKVPLVVATALVVGAPVVILVLAVLVLMHAQRPLADIRPLVAADEGTPARFVLDVLNELDEAADPAQQLVVVARLLMWRTIAVLRAVLLLVFLVVLVLAPFVFELLVLLLLAAFLLGILAVLFLVLALLGVESFSFSFASLASLSLYFASSWSNSTISSSWSCSSS
jgi:hypothetical protein